VEVPDFLQGLGVVGRQRAVGMADKDQIAGGRERAAVVRIFELEPDLGLAGGGINRLEAAVETLGGFLTAAGEAFARLDRAALVDEVLLLDRLEIVAALDRRNVEQLELGIVGGGLPVLAAEVRRAQPFALGLGTGAVAARRIFLHVGVRVVVERPAGLGIEARRPVQLVDVLLAEHERAVGAVERVVETVARRVHHELAILAVDLGVDDRVLGDFIEVVRIVRGVLVTPLDLAVVGAEREHARRPLAVARPVFRIPVGAGIADALVEGVALRIIGGGLPDRAAAVLPALLAVLPGLVAGLAGARDGVGAPNLLAGIEVGGVDPAADAELAAGAADDGDVADDQRRDGERLGDGGIGDLALPHHLAGRLVEREQAAGERDRDHLGLPQGHAAIVDAAAGHVAGPGAVGAGIELPLDHAFLAAGSVDRIDRAPAVGDVDDAVLDQRRALEIAELVTAAALEAAERDGEHRP